MSEIEVRWKPYGFPSSDRPWASCRLQQGKSLSAILMTVFWDELSSQEPDVRAIHEINAVQASAQEPAPEQQAQDAAEGAALPDGPSNMDIDADADAKESKAASAPATEKVVIHPPLISRQAASVILPATSLVLCM